MEDGLYLFYRPMLPNDVLNFARYGADFPQDIIAQTRMIEIWAPRDHNNGSNFLEYRAFDDDRQRIATKRVYGGGG